MAKEVYNFVGVSSPAGDLSHKGFVGESSSSGIPTPPSGDEGSQTNYDQIEAIDAVNWQNSLDPPSNYYPFKMFRWYIPPDIALPWRFTVTHVGVVPTLGPGNLGFTLQIYNVKMATWEVLDTSQTYPPEDVYETLTGSVRRARRFYMDSSRYAWTAVINNFWHTALVSVRKDDYTELAVDWWAGIKRWAPGWGEGIEPPYGEV